MDTYSLLVAICLTTFGFDVGNINKSKIMEFVESFQKGGDDIENAISSIYTKIKSYEDSDKDLLYELVMIMSKSYIANCKDSDDVNISLFSAGSKDDVVRVFLTSSIFAEVLIRDFIKNLFVKSDRVVQNYRNLDLLMKYDSDIKISFITDTIRNYLACIKSYFRSPKWAYAFIERNLFFPISVKEKSLHEAMSFIKKYYGLTMRVVYADVYEFLLTNGASIKELSDLKGYIERKMASNDYSLSHDYTIENELLFSAFYAMNDYRRAGNHRYLDKKLISALRKINPLFMLDESGIMLKG